MGIAVAAVFLAVLGLGGVLPVASASIGVSKTDAPPPSLSAPVPVRSRPSHKADPVTTHMTKKTVAAAVATPPRPLKSSCRSVVYIGDSTSEGEISTDYIPNPRQRLQAQLADVGVTTVNPEISGARSIVETFEGLPNAATVALDHVQCGFHGCWILAMGTNDVDNVARGRRARTGRPDPADDVDHRQSAGDVG